MLKGVFPSRVVFGPARCGGGLRFNLYLLPRRANTYHMLGVWYFCGCKIRGAYPYTTHWA